MPSNGDDDTGDDGGGGNCDEGMRHFVEQQVCERTSPDRLGELAQRYELRRKAAHAEVDGGVAKDRRAEDDAGQGERVRGGEVGSDIGSHHRSDHHREEASYEIYGGHVEPEARRLSIAPTKGEVTGKKEHRGKADDIAEKRRSAALEARNAEHEQTTESDYRRDDFVPPRLLLGEYQDNDGKKDRQHVYDEAGVCGDGVPRADVPTHEVNSEKDARQNRGPDETPVEFEAEPAEVANEERAQNEHCNEQAIRGQSKGMESIDLYKNDCRGGDRLTSEEDKDLARLC